MLLRRNAPLASPDPAADPVIEEDMISDERDRVRMVDGVRRLVELASSGDVQRDHGRGSERPVGGSAAIERRQ